jgi:hypothetical protein
MKVMRTLARVTAFVMALLLLARAGWAMPECESASKAALVSHHNMPAGQHDHMPAPADHHGGCQLALCAMMSGCVTAALHANTVRVAPASHPAARFIALEATSSPVGPQAPDPPPPRT